MSKAKINLEALQKLNTTPPKKKQRLFQKKGFSIFKKSDDSDEKECRGIPFATRPLAQKLTFVLYLVFFGMFIVLVLTFGRLNTITHLAKAKAVDQATLVSHVKKDLTREQLMSYQGANFIRAMINWTKSDEEKDTYQKAVSPYLANGLSAENLTFSQANGDRKVANIDFIQQEDLDGAKDTHLLSYTVTYTEDNQTVSLDLKVPVSFAHEQLRVIDAPVVSNLQQLSDTNKAKANDHLWQVKGDTLSADEEKKVSDFMANFFDLYTKNDEKLSMISQVQGLKGATLDNQTVTTVVQTGSDRFVVTGSYQIHYGSGGAITSPYQVTLEKNGDTYFVNKMN